MKEEIWVAVRTERVCRLAGALAGSAAVGVTRAATRSAAQALTVKEDAIEQAAVQRGRLRAGSSVGLEEDRRGDGLRLVTRHHVDNATIIYLDRVLLVGLAHWLRNDHRWSFSGSW